MTSGPTGRGVVAAKAGRCVLDFAKDMVLLARDAGMRWADDACYRLGASLAYYALFSLFPLMLLSVTWVGFVLGDDDHVRQKLLATVAGATSPESRALLDETLKNMQTHRTARGVGAIVGVVTLFLGSSGVFSELESSLNFIWRVKPAPTKGIWPTVLQALRAKAFSFAVVIAAAGALLASLVVGTILGAIGDSATTALGARAPWQIVEMGASVGFLTLLLAAIYRLVPQAPVAWRDVLGAALLASLLFAGLKALLAWYLAHLGSYAAYGAVGGVLGLLMWIYSASWVLFFGAEVSRVYAEKFGSLRERPESHIRCAASPKA
jgi:membrane protein